MKTSVKSAIAALLVALPAMASAASDIAMHRDPGCDCCEKWAAQVQRQFARKVIVIDDANRAAFKRQVGVPANLNSCHTAVVDGMVFEGHVPIDDMKRVLATHPPESGDWRWSACRLARPGWKSPA
jgi:hypothetical protein